MREVIEKLLILQDRDRKLLRVQEELAHIAPERQMLLSRAANADAALEKTRQKVRQIESDRKGLELEIEAKKQLIVRYANQQLQTRKNEEYRALANEIQTCKDAIFRIEDQEIALMEQAETGQNELKTATAEAAAARKLAEELLAQLATREQNLRTEHAQLAASREELAAAVPELARAKYERLLRNKGHNVVVGVQHGVCGGCHMRLPPQLLVSCQAKKEMVTCSNCGRILYYTRDMDMAVAD